MTTRSIISLQRSIAEAGRIRIGQQVATQSGGRRPAKLDTFRLTSPDKVRIEQAAELFGGKVGPWASPNGKQWEVITERDSLDVIVPPSDLSFSQAYELWSAGGAKRRCDGINEDISQGPCLCDPEARECDIHTRLSLLIRELPGLGVWRLDTQGYYAATELRGAVEIITLAAGVGRLLPARLRLDQRSVKRPGKDGKPETRRFAVPVLDVEVTAAALLESAQAVPLAVATAEAPLTPVPMLPGPTVAEQVAPPPQAPMRSNGAAQIPASGRKRAARATEQPTEGVDGDGPEDIPATPTVDTRTAPPSASQPAQESEPEDSPAASSEAPASAPTTGAVVECDHPKDRYEEVEEGLICGVCRTVLEPPPDLGPKPDQSSEDYWMARLHAVAAERNVDHAGIRIIAAALKRLPASEGGVSLKTLDAAFMEGLDKLFRSFDAGLDVDRTTDWVFKIAAARDMGDWKVLDPLAAASISGLLDEAGVADWIAFGLRLHAGEFDPQPAEPDPAVEPEPVSQARPRATK